MGSGLPLRRNAFRVAELLAWTLGALLIGLYVAIRAHQTSAARSGVRQFERQRALESTPSRSLSWAEPDQSLWAPERVLAWRAAGAAASPLAVLRIPKIKLEVPVLEGTDDATLDRGVGHIEGTALPGSSSGNLGIAGHRDGFFRGLKDIGTGDEIRLESLKGTVEYAVDSIRLVDPDDVWVLDPTLAPELTLVTCYPFYYVGSAPRRYVVKASPVRSPPGF
jgi:sortase A